MRNDITAAAELLRTGGTVAFPTETVYGLGADISVPSAISKIFEIKQRPTNHPLIVHIADTSQLQHWAKEIPESAWKLAEHFWPGPLTLILQCSHRIPKSVTGGQNTVGLRIPNHPVALDLLNAIGADTAIAAPSANQFGRISPTTATHVQDELGEAVDMILDGGACKVGLESTIVSFNNEIATILRPGGIPLDALTEVLNGQIILANKNNNSERTPGTHASHYAPKTPLEMHSSERIFPYALELAAQGIHTIIITWSNSIHNQPANEHITIFSMPHNPIDYGKQLYATLHQFDNKKLDRLLIETPPDTPDWLAINDRLNRARKT